jgi:hypothetical protein
MFIIDRFEGDFAVIEYNNKTFNLPRTILPVDAREGDVIIIASEIDKTVTEERKEESKDLLRDFFDK